MWHLACKLKHHTIQMHTSMISLMHLSLEFAIHSDESLNMSRSYFSCGRKIRVLIIVIPNFYDQFVVRNLRFSLKKKSRHSRLMSDLFFSMGPKHILDHACSLGGNVKTVHFKGGYVRVKILGAKLMLYSHHSSMWQYLWARTA